MAIGDYARSTWVNGTTPAINQTNLNNIDAKVLELDTAIAADNGVLSKSITTANVTLSTAEAEQNSVIIISGALTGNRGLIIPNGIKKQYKLVVQCTGNYYVRVQTDTTGTDYDVYGLVSTDETAIQAYYAVNFISDGANIYGDDWHIRGSNANGYYERRSSGILSCRRTDTLTVDAITNTNIGSYGWSYYLQTTNQTWTFPYAYSTTDGLTVGMSAVLGHPYITVAPTVSAVEYNIRAASSASRVAYLSAEGTWK